MTEAERRSLRGLVATLLGNPTPFEAADLPVDLVRRHMLAPLAHKAGCAAFRNDCIAASLQAERRATQLVQSLDALGSAGIPVILLKGIAYAGTLYPDPSERPMSDIDLLVRSPDISSAERALCRLGYWRAGSAAQESATRHAITLKRRDGSIDLHRHILHAGRSRIDLDAIWRDARPAHVPGALRPAPLHEYLLHVAHIGRHEGMVPLVNYVDALRLASGLDWEAVRNLSSTWAVSRVCSAVARSLDDLSLRPKAAPDRFSFPTVPELLSFSFPPRWLQLIRKVRTVDDLSGLHGLVSSTVRSYLAPFRPRRDRSYRRPH